MCPYCEKMFSSEDFENNHIENVITNDRRRQFNKSTRKKSTMEFRNLKTILKDLLCLLDLESTLLKREARKMNDEGKEANTQIIHEHRPNSCCFNFMCTFDSSRNELKSFEGYDCVKNMIIEMHEMSQELHQRSEETY